MTPVARRSLVVLAAIAALASGGYVVLQLTGPEDADATRIDVVTRRYEYVPGTDAALNVTLGDLVVIRVKSADVTHGFAISEYGIQEEVPAGQEIEVRFRATRAGSFTIYCTVFCGSGHPDHKGTLHVA